MPLFNWSLEFRNNCTGSVKALGSMFATSYRLCRKTNVYRQPLPAKMSIKLRQDHREVTTARPPVGNNLHLLLPFVLILPLVTVTASPTASRFKRRAVGWSMDRTIIVLPLFRRVSIWPSMFLVPAYVNGSFESKIGNAWSNNIAMASVTVSVE